MNKTYEMGRGTAVYPLLYVFFEKLRIYENQSKSDERIENEKLFPNGLSLKRRNGYLKILSPPPVPPPLPEEPTINDEESYYHDDEGELYMSPVVHVTSAKDKVGLRELLESIEAEFAVSVQ